MTKYDKLLQNITPKLDELKSLKEDLDRSFGLEDFVYRFYHQSFKVYSAGYHTNAAMKLFKEIAGKDFTINEWYVTIVNEGLKEFKMEHNKNWLKNTRPILEALFHTKYFIDMLIKYGEKYKKDKIAPKIMPSGWAAITYLFNVR